MQNGIIWQNICGCVKVTVNIHGMQNTDLFLTKALFTIADKFAAI